MQGILFPEQQDYIESLRTQSSGLIAEMEAFATDKRIPILHWQSAAILEFIIKSAGYLKILEIGTAIAYSSIRIALQTGNTGKIDTIEKSRDNIKLASQYLKRSACENIINIIEGDALDILPKINDSYDLVFLDADKEDYAALYKLSAPLVSQGGTIFIDNLLWHGYAASGEVPLKYTRSSELIRNFNEIFLADKRFNSMIYPIGDGLGIGIRI